MAANRFERGTGGNQPEGASAGRPTKGMRRQLYLVGKDDPTVRTVADLRTRVYSVPNTAVQRQPSSPVQA